jgi:hypothetical protein
LHVGAGLLQDRTGFGVHEVHAHLFQDGQRGIVDGLELVLGHHRRRRKAVLQAAVAGRGGGAAHRATGAAGAAPGGARRLVLNLTSNDPRDLR